MDFRDYLKHAPTAIQELIRKFRDRYCVFNNKATGAEQENQREQLLALVQDVARSGKIPHAAGQLSPGATTTEPTSDNY